MFTKTGPKTWEASLFASMEDFLCFLEGELPSDMYVSFQGSLFRFRTKEERVAFRMGVHVALEYIAPRDWAAA